MIEWSALHFGLCRLILFAVILVDDCCGFPQDKAKFMTDEHPLGRKNVTEGPSIVRELWQLNHSDLGRVITSAQVQGDKSEGVKESEQSSK